MKREVTTAPEIAVNAVSIGEARRRSLANSLCRAGAGDRHAFAVVYQQTSATLFGLCMRILPNRAEAEDILQDVYISVWRQAGRYDPARASPMPWLIAIARNRSIDRLRALGGRREAPIAAANSVPDPAPNVELRLVEEEDRQGLGRCMGVLAAADAGFIRTAFFDGLSYSALAEQARIPLGTLKSRIRRALARLRDCLSE